MARTTQKRRLGKAQILPYLFTLWILVSACCCRAMTPKPGVDIAIASHRHDYEDAANQQRLSREKACDFRFGRFQSPESIKQSFDDCRSVDKSFKMFKGKDGRKGYTSSTKLQGDWVLAESEQICPDCTTEQVIDAYLSAKLQTKWNANEVSECKITRTKTDNGEACYQQDLILKSQRVITSRTGVMRYAQTILVDKIENSNFCISVTLDPNDPNTTEKKPFDVLKVYAGLQQRGSDVYIYIAGVMKVNRKVVPNLIIFDASGIAGGMAGKGTLWLAGHFEELKQKSATPTMPLEPAFQ